ncbi:transglutaminase-like domain-containing protein [uncultured Cohaesibacter sp.]|uniref:transglutaminase-like domain-containing protein n=1 Tax=uncultured Cohaesibacter sp. TaxID=1002546 RepID=UPI002930501E|nr:transglutaminase-like domain-containing protein [uncultured Cohaesibacter sp.]
MNDVVLVTVDASQPRGMLLAPLGLDTSHERAAGFAVQGADMKLVREANTGQNFALLEPENDEITIMYEFEENGDRYPDALFTPHDSRFTRSADALISEAQSIGVDLCGRDRIAAIACATAERFSYGHPARKYYDGCDEIPALGCGIAEGSCVDINTYFIASLRAAGFEAGYVAGYFFPKEKIDRCDDMHCWVVTRHDGVCHEWDIAHHLKMGRKDIEPGLNPKPGFRHAVSHSMGFDIPDLRIREMKLLAEPVWVDAEGRLLASRPSIWCPKQTG